MGGGASAFESNDELLAATFMIGRAIAAITFPGMFRIYDFHSPRAPRIKAAAQFSFFGYDSDSDDENNVPIDPEEYCQLFHVTVGDDVVYLEDPLGQNECGWTPLHACCMSFATVNAGKALIEEYQRQGRSVDAKTLAGPGTFNSQWTALHMVCAYGVEPLVDLLVQAGADVNTTNSFGYTPILEACHRGYFNVVEKLLQSGKADLAYIPAESDAYSSPFVNSPPQTPLGEAARSGFQKIVQLLLDHNAPKDAQNSLGWTALHEACFFNRVETVKSLLLAGCKGNIRTRSGALPYHLASLKMVREMLEDMGGPTAKPRDSSDMVDMVQVLRELTSFSEDERGSRKVVETSTPKALTGGRITSENAAKNGNEVKFSKRRGDEQEAVEREVEEKKDELLHRGGVLGDLPALLSPEKVSPDKTMLQKHTNAHIDGAVPMSGLSNATVGDHGKKKKKNKSMQKPAEKLPKDTPPEFVCALTQRLMSDPLKSIYGQRFESTAIHRWLTDQGRICPITGVPLSENDLVPDDELKEKIQKWILERSQNLGGVANGADNAKSLSSAAARKDDDELYDF